MMKLRKTESLGAFLGFPVMDGDVYGIRGDELDRRIQQMDNEYCLQVCFSILVPDDMLADTVVHPIINLKGAWYEFQYAFLGVAPRIWVQIQRVTPFANRRTYALVKRLTRSFTTSVVSVPDLYRMNGDESIPDRGSAALRRSSAAPFPP